MTKTKYSLVLFAAAALSAAPSLASAQARSAPMTPETGTAMHANRPIAINGHFSFPLADSCTYQADVTGMARPVNAATTVNGDERFTPNVNVEASVTCPNATTIRVRERVVSEQPMTMAELQEALELRASLITHAAGLHCAYVPDFRLSRERLEGVGAALLCPLPAQGAVRGGGPKRFEKR